MYCKGCPTVHGHAPAGATSQRHNKADESASSAANPQHPTRACSAYVSTPRPANHQTVQGCQISLLVYAGTSVSLIKQHPHPPAALSPKTCLACVASRRESTTLPAGWSAPLCTPSPSEKIKHMPASRPTQCKPTQPFTHHPTDRPAH